MDQSQNSGSIHTSSTVKSDPSPLRRQSSTEKPKHLDFKDELSWHVKGHKPPNGEFILKVFGKFLFDAACSTVALIIVIFTTLLSILSIYSSHVSMNSINLTLRMVYLRRLDLQASRRFVKYSQRQRGL